MNQYNYNASLVRVLLNNRSIISSIASSNSNESLFKHYWDESALLVFIMILVIGFIAILVWSCIQRKKLTTERNKIESICLNINLK